MMPRLVQKHMCVQERLHSSDAKLYLEVQNIALVHGRSIKCKRCTGLAESQVIGKVCRRCGVVILRRVLTCVKQQPLQAAAKPYLI
jgi:hypothetical protein